MVFVIILLIVLVFAFIGLYEDGLPGFILSSVVSGVIGAIVFFGIVGASQAALEKTSVSTTTSYSLQALNNGKDNSGTFFLGSGTLDSVDYVSYVYKEGEWSRIGKIKANDALIAEDANSENVRLDVATTSQKLGWLAPFDFKSDKYQFHVPKGSIISNYEITAE